MKEKELRLALVYYGGVSLAIYQHGVNVEILNLVRASKGYHTPRSYVQKQAGDHVFAPAPHLGTACSTEPVYFDLLKLIGKTLDLRVLVDVISGSSAGGINGIVLARALAHDLRLSPITDMWFAKADIVQLIAPEARAGRWSKWYLAPFMRLLIAGLEREGVLPHAADPAFRRRISTFIRSRWFKPPFDGAHFSGLLLDGLNAMEGNNPSSSTLLPPETRLDLMITVTDYHGAEKLIFMHDPALIREREHRQMLRFRASTGFAGLSRSDFTLADIPSLAFAGRASASYPGAFPPAQVREMDRILTARQCDWPGREQFLAANFGHYQQIGLDPEEAVLLDGSILNNKPILAAINAIRMHTAYREVDRRLVYIDPRPDRARALPSVRIPGFFATLRGALSDLPRHDPIYEELEETNRFNDQIERLQAIVRLSQPQIDAMIEQATGGALAGDITTAQMSHWRLTSTNLLSASPLIYNAWMRSLVLEATDVIANLVARTCGYNRHSQQARWVSSVIETWCGRQGMFPDSYHIPDTVNVDAQLPPFARFIVDFGTRYKSRRISYVIWHINSIYELIYDNVYPMAHDSDVDEIKKRVNECLQKIQFYEEPAFLDKLPSAEIKALFCTDANSRQPDAEAFAISNHDALTRVIAAIGAVCGLVGTNEELDVILTSPTMSALHPELRRIILTGFLGWPYWDVMVLPAMNALGLEHNMFEKVLVDRISPKDTHCITLDSMRGPLRGEAAIGFGGFLSRAARENDYLWGRLHAIDRLIDIVADAIPRRQCDAMPDFMTLKKRAFQAVMAQEETRLTCIPDVMAAVRAAIDRL